MVSVLERVDCTPLGFKLSGLCSALRSGIFNLKEVFLFVCTRCKTCRGVWGYSLPETWIDRSLYLYRVDSTSVIYKQKYIQM